MDNKTSYFISDAHLGADIPGYEHRERDLIQFLGELEGHAQHLFILGDLFEFWIEYGVLCRGDYFQVLHALRNLVESGTEIHYLAGNHDFAFDRFLPEEIGVSVHRRDLRLKVHGKDLYLFHGDGLLRADVGYRILRVLFRSRFNQRLYKILHPAVGIGFASRVSMLRRRHFHVQLDQSHLAEYRRAAIKHLNAGSEIVVFGHTHMPQLFAGEGKAYCNTGEWIRRYSYGKLYDGKMGLWQYLPGSEDQPFSATPLK